MEKAGVALYHRVLRRENFEKAAKDLVSLVYAAEKKEPGKPRILYLDIDGHRNAQNCQRRMVKNLKRRPENDPNAGNIALVIYAGTLSAGQLSAGSSAGGTGWTPAFHRSLSR